MPASRGTERKSDPRDAAWARAVLRTYGDVCHICGHGGARQADHLVPETERPDLRWSVPNGRPAHGAGRGRGANPCPVCKQHCNQLRGYGSVERARRKITERTGMAMPGDGKITPDATRNAGRDWLA